MPQSWTFPRRPASDAKDSPPDRSRFIEAVAPPRTDNVSACGGGVDAALDALGDHEQRVGLSGRMTARFHEWELTKDTVHLEEAKRLLDFAVEHTAEESRTSMIENVPLHRDIRKAWEERGGAE